MALAGSYLFCFNDRDTKIPLSALPVHNTKISRNPKGKQPIPIIHSPDLFGSSTLGRTSKVTSSSPLRSPLMLRTRSVSSVGRGSGRGGGMEFGTGLGAGFGTIKGKDGKVVVSAEAEDVEKTTYTFTPSATIPVTSPVRSSALNSPSSLSRTSTSLSSPNAHSNLSSSSTSSSLSSNPSSTTSLRSSPFAKAMFVVEQTSAKSVLSPQHPFAFMLELPSNLEAPKGIEEKWKKEEEEKKERKDEKEKGEKRGIRVVFIPDSERETMEWMKAITDVQNCVCTQPSPPFYPP